MHAQPGCAQTCANLHALFCSSARLFLPIARCCCCCCSTRYAWSGWFFPSAFYRLSQSRLWHAVAPCSCSQGCAVLCCVDAQGWPHVQCIGKGPGSCGWVSGALLMMQPNGVTNKARSFVMTCVEEPPIDSCNSISWLLEHMCSVAVSSTHACRYVLPQGDPTWLHGNTNACHRQSPQPPRFPAGIT